MQIVAAAATFRGAVDISAGVPHAENDADDADDAAGEGQRRAIFDFANIGKTTPMRIIQTMKSLNLNHKPLMFLGHELVSGNRSRFIDGRFNLDLT